MISQDDEITEKVRYLFRQSGGFQHLQQQKVKCKYSNEFYNMVARSYLHPYGINQLMMIFLQLLMGVKGEPCFRVEWNGKSDCN
jgi:hypothetical protein